MNPPPPTDDMDVDPNRNQTHGTIVTSRGRVSRPVQIHNEAVQQPKNRNQCNRQESIESPYDSVKKQMNVLRTKIRKNELQNIKQSIPELKQSLNNMITVLDEFEKTLDKKIKTGNQEVIDDDFCRLFGDLFKGQSPKSQSLKGQSPKSQQLPEGQSPKSQSRKDQLLTNTTDAKKRKLSQNGGRKK